MKTTRNYFFNMIEISLAIAIVAIGLTSVISIIPFALKSESGTKTEYYSSDIADTAKSFVEMELANLKANDRINVLTSYPDVKPMYKVNGDYLDFNSVDVTTVPVSSGVKNISQVKFKGDILDGIYEVAFSTNSINDVKGEIKVWKSTTTPAFGENNQRNADINLAQLVGLNVEISAPIEKPYEQREIYRYYFENFNNDYNNSVYDDYRENKKLDPDYNPYESPIDLDLTSEEPEEPIVEPPVDDDEALIEKEDKEIIINKIANLKITILASELCAGSAHAPVYVRVSVKTPDGNSQEYNCFTGYQFFYDMPNDLTSNQYKRTSNRKLEVAAIPGGDTWNIDVPKGSTYKVWAGYYYRSNTYARYDWQGRERGRIVNSYWSTNEHQVYTLLNGNTPPRFNPSRHQLTPEECVQEYLNDDGLVTLNDNQVLYLFELSHTDLNDQGFDMQDLVVLAEITES